MITNFLTIDIEEWFHPTLIKPYITEDLRKYHRIVNNTNRILELLSKFNTKATFFILGEVAEQVPGLVKEIYKGGHEIATHGYGHNLVFSQSPNEFRLDLQRSISLLEDITGEKIRGCRVPTWSITEKSLWALEIIKESGLSYDSSISPAIFDLTKYYDCTLRKGFLLLKKDSLIEFPQTTIKLLGKNISFGGGFFLRLYPYFFTKSVIEDMNKNGVPAMVYLHPWELDCDAVQPTVPFKNRFISYANTRSLTNKLKFLLSDFKFIKLATFIEQQINDAK